MVGKCLMRCPRPSQLTVAMNCPSRNSDGLITAILYVFMCPPLNVDFVKRLPASARTVRLVLQQGRTSPHRRDGGNFCERTTFRRFAGYRVRLTDQLLDTRPQRVSVVEYIAAEPTSRHLSKVLTKV